MKRNLFLITGTLACTTGIAGIIALMAFGKQDVYMMSVGITGILTCCFLLLDNDNKEGSKKMRPLALLACIAIAIMLMVSMSSCSTSGYGCHGRSKCMTRVQ